MGNVGFKVFCVLSSEWKSVFVSQTQDGKQGVNKGFKGYQYDMAGWRGRTVWEYSQKTNS